MAKVKKYFLFTTELTEYSLSKALTNVLNSSRVCFNVVLRVPGSNICVTLNRALLNLSESQFIHL